MAADRPTIYFASQRDWEAWLEQNHEDSPGVWIKMAKKASGIASLNHKEALEEALCFGWIDGQARSLDEQYTLRMFTPRRPRSTWSKINVGHIERLATEGRIRPAGQREVDAAKADGRWDAAYSSQATIEVPGDFARALESEPGALAFFDSLNKTARWPFLFRLTTIKKPETRARRIALYVELLAEGKTLH
ncbi:YdeI/OmpD-associated family protein [Mycobacteroides abscessus]|uniref:YdeI/OmpD-associated family protein n=1 Tax=Mycobacteroides abscessus TaxID=36809 RepID=UPI000C256451|nr:YdeI/OmpD-associated family protein [Mycobacteroides abscessus]